ncbi:MAG: sulfatase-like hydrolase/transferase [Chloroflexi bacterium]|nr:sulfatase-like hydrolase/transferase [Chloroflexota bacterium]
MKVSERHTSQRPNILFFFADDQRFDTIQALANSHIQTPNLDKLAERGTFFSHAFIPGGTSGAVCMPSRAMLHTGRTLFHLQGAGESIPRDHIMLGEHLRANGYQTFGTGKWHNGPESYARSFSAGAEIFFGGMDDHWNVPAFDFDPTGHYESTFHQCIDAWHSKAVRVRLGDHVTAGKHSSELFADAAIDYLQAYDSDDPLFMYLAFMAPHDPRIMPPEYRAMYDPEQIPLPANFMGGHPFDNGDLKVRDELLADFPRDPGEIREHIADYYAMITHLDAQIGRVMETLEKSGKAENTIILFAGDNGLALGQHGLMGKQNLYEHSVRVPLLFAGPGISKNQKCDALVYLLDIYPTLCDLIGVETPESVEGRSLLTALQDKNTRAREALYLAYTSFQRAVRDERFKLIEYHVNGKHHSQFFDLVEDPLELNNLVGKAVAVAEQRRLRQELLRLRDEWDDMESDWGRRFWLTDS